MCIYLKRSLRKVGYVDDIVLAVSPPDKMKPNVEKYLSDMHVLAYAFEVDCKGKDNCRFKDEFLGYPDPRPFRTFANMRYGLYGKNAHFKQITTRNVANFNLSRRILATILHRELLYFDT